MRKRASFIDTISGTTIAKVPGKIISILAWRYVVKKNSVLLILGLAVSFASILSACDSEQIPSSVVITPPPAPQGGPPLDPALFPQPGSTEFLTANSRELLSDGTDGYSRGHNSWDALAESNSANAGGDPGVPPPSPEPTPDVSREIVEADVFKLEGDLLYVLNRYRGLVIIDVSNPDAMTIRGRLPFQAMPVEMYIRDGRAYVVNSDYFVHWQYDPEADPHGFHGSQVMIADVSDPDHPTSLGSLNVDGEITDTRMVGDVLYTVSKRRADYWRYNTADWEDTTWIVSLNVADPANIREIERITFQGTSTLIHVAHHAIFVAAWDPNYYLSSSLMEQETLVTYVDISDPTGRLKKRGTVYIPGQIADKFKMDWHEGYLRVLSQRWNSDAEASLHVISTATPDLLKIDANIDLLGVNRSGLQATRFAGNQAFAFTRDWISSTEHRYLHGIDLTQPLQPKLAGVKEVYLNASHIEVHGDRLLAFGRHYKKGFYSDESRVALNLFDVSNLAAIQELSLARLGEKWSSSEASHDYKALKTFPQLELILVPLRYYNNGVSFNGVQLVDWVGDALTERGRVNSTGGVRRAFPVGDRIVAVGEMTVVSINAQDRDNPTVTNQLRLVHQVHEVFNIQGKQVQLVTDAYTGQVRLEVRDFGGEDNSPTLAELDLPFSGTPFVLRDGDVLHLIGSEPLRGQVIRNVNMSVPTNPELRGELLLTDEFWSVFHPGWGWYRFYWTPQAGLPLRNQIIPATFRKIIEQADGRREWESELRFLDLRDLDNPRVAAGTVPMNDFPFVNKVTHGNILYSSHVEQATTPDGNSLLYHVRSYVDRVDVTDPDHPQALPMVNIPGYLVDVSDDGSLWYTVDYQWDEFGRRRNSLNVLRLVNGDTAELIEVIPVADQIDRTAMRPGQLSEQGGRAAGWNDRTLWLTAHKYPWWGVHSDTITSRQPYTIIRRVVIAADGHLAADAKTSFNGYHLNLLDVDQSQMLLSSPSPSGIMVVDVADLANPVIAHTARTLNYVSRIVMQGGHAYAPLGMYGLQRY